ncbi:MAG: MFS transporter [Parcubacteria group bacterium]|nr:MFS transporter [Parcubacteria group bacterium]
MSLSVIMFQTSMMIGPALAGIVISQFGIGFVYLINAISFFSVIAALILMKTSGEIEGTPSRVSLRAVLDGLAFVKSKTIIWSTTLLDFFSTFFASATALLPIFAENILRVGPMGFGFLYAAPSIGAVLAGYVLARMGTMKHQGKILLASVAMYGTATMVFGLSKMFWLSFFALFLIGIGDSISVVIRSTIRQLTTPDHIRGRMSSVNMIFSMGGPQLGAFEAGVLAAALGGPLSVAIGGAGALAVTAIVAAKIPALRNYSREK